MLDALQGVAQDRSGPRLEWTRLPAYGSLDDVEGQAFNVDPSAYAVALYIYIGGWWTKPTFEAPLTRLGDDGGWRIDSSVPLKLIPRHVAIPEDASEYGYEPKVYQNADNLVFVEREAS